MATKVKLTEALIRNLPLPPAGKRETWQDTAVPYLQLRTSSTGTKSYSIYRRVHGGQTERIHIGRAGIISLDAAREAGAKINQAIELRQNPNDIKKALQGELTFAMLFTKYMAIHSKPHKLSWREDESKYAQYLEKPLSKLKISTITQADIKAIHRGITATGKSVVANRVIALISSIFGFAISEDLLKSNPCYGIKKNKEVALNRYLEAAELAPFFKALETEPSQTMRDFFLLCLLTGARSGNVKAMRWEQLDLESGVWVIPRTKNGTSQTVTLAQQAIDVLKARVQTSEWVLPSNSTEGHMVAPAKSWTNLCERAKLKDLRIHSLRHSMASWQAINGSSLLVIGRSLNHKSPAMTARYAHLSNDAVRSSVNAAVDMMWSHRV